MTGHHYDLPYFLISIDDSFEIDDFEGKKFIWLLSQVLSFILRTESPYVLKECIRLSTKSSTAFKNGFDSSYSMENDCTEQVIENSLEYITSKCIPVATSNFLQMQIACNGGRTRIDNRTCCYALACVITNGRNP